MIKLKQPIYIACSIALLIGGFALITIWYYADTAMAIQLSIGLFFVLTGILSTYIDKRKSLTCPRCESYHAADLIQTTECLDEIAQREFSAKILVFTYKCKVCHHVWYIHKNEKKQDGIF